MDLNKKKILITGGAGFIGSNLVMALQKEHIGAEIFVIDDFSSGNINNLMEFKGKIIRGDIADINLEKCFPKLDIILEVGIFCLIAVPTHHFYKSTRLT